MFTDKIIEWIGALSVLCVFIILTTVGVRVLWMLLSEWVVRGRRGSGGYPFGMTRMDERTMYDLCKTMSEMKEQLDRIEEEVKHGRPDEELLDD